MEKKLLPAILVVFMALTAFAPQANALVLGPRMDNGFPQWIGDGADRANPGLQLRTCNRPGNHDLEIGPCLAEPGIFTYYAMEVIPVTPPAGVTQLRIIVEVIGAKEIDPELGPGLLNIMGADIIFRLRGDAVVPGSTYTFSTPYGDFDFVADAAGRVQGSATGLHSLGPAFAEIRDPLLNPIQTFFRADLVQATGPTPPLGFLGDGVTPMTVTGVTFSVTGDGVNFTTDQAAIQGKIYNESGAGVTALLEGTPPSFITVDTGANAALTTIEPVVGGRQFNPVSTPTLNVTPLTIPGRIAITDGLVPPQNAVVVKVADTVTITSARINRRTNQLIVRANSNLRPAPDLTVHDADTGVRLGNVVGGVASIPRAKAAGVVNVEVRSSFGGFAGPQAVAGAQ